MRIVQFCMLRMCLYRRNSIRLSALLLARIRKHPYMCIVKAISFHQFFEFKQFLQFIRVANTIKTADRGEKFKLTEIMELRVLKSKLTKIFLRSPTLRMGIVS